ncbi:MAG: acetylxylan esterase [Verrucomicrobia bacterium]|nr:acetylxylan esterase [Verrucomicrobiota bacterium]
MRRTLCILFGVAAMLPATRPCRADARDEQRWQLIQMLGLPARGGDLHAESRGSLPHDGLVIEKWVLTAEPGSRVPTLLYRPAKPALKMPALVITHGHGGSKSRTFAQYPGQLYARLGLAVLVIDPIGEEERHIAGKLGTRAHDDLAADARAAKAGRLIMGKLVFDTMRAIDWLLTRNDIDAARIGVAGVSNGGAQATWLAALDRRIKAALVGGWAYDDVVLPTKLCQRVPFTKMREVLAWPGFIALAAPSCAIMTANGDADEVIDMGDRAAWSRHAAHLRAARSAWPAGGPEPLTIFLEPAGGHRPYTVYRPAMLWVYDQLGTPSMDADNLRRLPVINAGAWCDRHGAALERATGTEHHVRGATIVDLGVRPLAPEALAVLKPGERGSPDFTIEGWLDQIEGKRGGKR